MADKSYYDTLGVSKTATADELKSAYRRLAKQYHPDMYAGKSDAEKKNAEEKFKEINHAYDVLSDPQKRAAYDQYGSENGPQFSSDGGFGGFGGFGGGGGFDMDDIINSFFGGFGGGGRQSSRSNAPQRGQDILMSMSISFEEAAFGVEKKVNVRRYENCPTCGGTGAKAGGIKTCLNCKGTGTVTQIQRTPFGQFQSTGACPHCKGKGKIVSDPCPTCGGQGRSEKTREVTINIPAGIENGQRITYPNEGNAGRNGGENGGLIVEVNVKPHKLFKRNGADIMVEYPISIVEAALGTTILVPTLSTPESFKIPEGTQSGTTFKLKGKGIKKLRSKFEYGDLYIKVIVEVPKSVNREQKDLLSKLGNSFETKQFPKKKEFKDKL